MSHRRYGAEIEGKPYDARIMRRLLGYLRPYRRQVVAALALMSLTALANLAGPYLIKIAIDEGMVGRNLPLLGWVVVLFIIANLVGWRARYSQISVMAWVGQNVVYTIRTRLFDHLQRLSLSFYDEQEVGRLMSRLMSDTDVLQELVSWAIVAVVSDLLTLGGIMVVMVSMNPLLSLLTFLVLPVMGLVTAFWRVRARQNYRRVRETIAQVNTGLQENIVGVRVVQSFAREELNIAHFEQINRTHLEANVHAARLMALFFPTVDFVSALAISLVIWYGGSRVLSRHLTAGMLVAFVLYIDRFFYPIRDMAQRYNTLQATMAAGERIFELLDTPPDIVEPPDAVQLPPLRGEVRFDHVSFSYDGAAKTSLTAKAVLDDVNLSVEAGQTVAFVGATGAGKSSLIKLLGRFYDVDRGSITVDGYDVRAISLPSLRRQMGVVLQETFLFSGTVMDNVRYGRLNATDEEVIEAAKTVGAHQFIEQMPQGYQTEVEEGGAVLSVGQRQLIAFARALLADPRILILDEATSSVDTQTERLIQRALERLLENRTAFIIAHRLSTIVRADKIVVIDEGRIVEMGTHEELLAQRGHYYNLYTMSFREPQTA